MLSWIVQAQLVSLMLSCMDGSVVESLDRPTKKRKTEQKFEAEAAVRQSTGKQKLASNSKLTHHLTCLRACVALSLSLSLSLARSPSLTTVLVLARSWKLRLACHWIVLSYTFWGIDFNFISSNLTWYSTLTLILDRIFWFQFDSLWWLQFRFRILIWIQTQIRVSIWLRLTLNKNSKCTFTTSQLNTSRSARLPKQIL